MEKAKTRIEEKWCSVIESRICGKVDENVDLDIWNHTFDGLSLVLRTKVTLDNVVYVVVNTGYKREHHD